MMGPPVNCDVTRGQKRPSLKRERNNNLLSFLILKQYGIFCVSVG